jgi:hypothetical protein
MASKIFTPFFNHPYIYIYIYHIQCLYLLLG